MGEVEGIGGSLQGNRCALHLVYEGLTGQVNFPRFARGASCSPLLTADGVLVQESNTGSVVHGAGVLILVCLSSHSLRQNHSASSTMRTYASPALPPQGKVLGLVWATHARV